MKVTILLKNFYETCGMKSNLDGDFMDFKHVIQIYFLTYLFTVRRISRASKFSLVKID